MSEQEFFKAQGGLLNNEAVQENLLQQLVRNAGQLNFLYRERLLVYLQGMQKNEIARRPTQGPLPFIGPDADRGGI